MEGWAPWKTITLSVHPTARCIGHVHWRDVEEQAPHRAMRVRAVDEIVKEIHDLLHCVYGWPVRDSSDDCDVRERITTGCGCMGLAVENNLCE